MVLKTNNHMQLEVLRSDSAISSRKSAEGSCILHTNTLRSVATGLTTGHPSITAEESGSSNSALEFVHRHWSHMLAPTDLVQRRQDVKENPPRC